MKLGIYVIGTNAYFSLAVRFIKKFYHFYKGSFQLEFIFFSDTDPRKYLPDSIKCNFFKTAHGSWLDGTNSKFKNILNNRDDINVDYLYYFDADTNINVEFRDWFIGGDIVAGEHFGNSSYMAFDPDNSDVYKKPFDRNPISSCCLSGSEEHLTYCYGAFFGGRYEKVLSMLSELNDLMEINKSKNYEPAVNDESYLNYYFNTRDVTIIPSSKFEFLISCKGGIDNTRDANLNIDDLKVDMEKCKNYIFDLENGRIVQGEYCMNRNLLNKLHCYYINPEDYTHRTERIENVVNKLNCKSSTRIKYMPSEPDKGRRCSINHINTLSDAIENDNFPMLILEDDAEFLIDNFEIPSIPEEANIIYLGGSLYSIHGLELEDYSDEYYRVHNMLSTHALIINDKKSAVIIKNLIEESLLKNVYMDVHISENSRNLVFLTPKTGPFFYQKDQLTENVTSFKWSENLNLLK